MLRPMVTIVCALLIFSICGTVLPLALGRAQPAPAPPPGSVPSGCYWGPETGRGFSRWAEATSSLADQSCRHGYAVRDAVCRGSWCSKITPLCCRYIAKDESARYSVTNFTISEERPRNIVESNQSFLAGIKCHGDYCDNIGTMFLSSRVLVNTGDCGWYPPFSEEVRGLRCRNHQFAAGVRCSGRYCDNLELKCCAYRFEPPVMMRDPRRPPPVPPNY